MAFTSKAAFLMLKAHKDTDAYFQIYMFRLIDS